MRGGTTRRRFVTTAGKLVMGLTAVAGGLVKFQPTALALAGGCNVYEGGLPDGACEFGCLGYCMDSGSSCCSYGSGYNDYACILCDSYCQPAQVVVYCRTPNDGSYFCAHYC